jgi:hypothetical protein
MPLLVTTASVRHDHKLRIVVIRPVFQTRNCVRLQVAVFGEPLTAYNYTGP